MRATSETIDAAVSGWREAMGISHASEWNHSESCADSARKVRRPEVVKGTRCDPQSSQVMVSAGFPVNSAVFCDSRSQTPAVTFSDDEPTKASVADEAGSTTPPTNEPAVRMTATAATMPKLGLVHPRLDIGALSTAWATLS